MTLTVLATGPMTLVQDLGRPGLGHLGVSSSGAFDRVAHRQANALLGNSPHAACLEVLDGGLSWLAGSDLVVAVCGAPVTVSVDGHLAAYGRAVHVAAGQQVTLGRPSAGLRTYVAVAGGIAVGAELGSRSFDSLAGLGPSPLSPGDVLAVGAPHRVPAVTDVPALVRTGVIWLDVVVGPRHDWFTEGSIRTLLEEPWTVTPVSSRIGVRLDGQRLTRARTDELPSEPATRGSVQIAADGLPIIFGPDHPVTGGYPVAAVVADAHTDLLAQARPGDVVRFRRAAGY